MNVKDPELRGLLVGELGRHLATLEDPAVSIDAARRAVHALKGAAGLADERDLAGALQRAERRLREGDASAIASSAAVVRAAAGRLARGESALGVQWPEPPDDLHASVVDHALRLQYDAELRDHLAAIDVVLAEPADALDAARALHRHVHSIKGGASAVGDEAMAWFCHGLEDRLVLREASERGASTVLDEAARWRAVLSMLMEDAEGALESLRSPSSRARASTMPQASHPTARPPDDEPPRSMSDEATIRVATGSVDQLLDRLVAIDLVRERLASRVDVAREQCRELRRLRGDLVDALRLIGPPRPWGAPAAALRRVEWTATSLASLGDELDQAAQDLGGDDQILKDSVSEARQGLSAMRLTTVGRIFARLSAVVEAESRRVGRTIIVRTQGAAETIDRRTSELLMEPCLQLVRNAVAHGIEEPTARVAAGKQEAGTVSVTARKAGGRLTVTIADDGAGVDMASVRARAVEAGALTQTLADAADDGTLLSLLFLPGFSTYRSSDLLAGRGFGMDISLASIQRLGGVIRLSSRAGRGFTAKIELPLDTGLATVMWVVAAGEQYAIPASRARVVRRAIEGQLRLPHLAACLEGHAFGQAAYSVELDDDDPEKGPLCVGVDEVGRTEDVLIRPLTPLLANAGPFAGVIVRGDGSLRLALDVYGLAPRARTLRRIPEPTASERQVGLRPARWS